MILRKYKEIMDRLEVTEEMRERILGNLQEMLLKDHLAFSKEDTRKRRQSYRKYIAAAAGIAVLLAGVFAVPRLGGVDTPEDPPTLELPGSGIEEKASAEELSDAVGFAVADISTLPFEVSERIYQSYSGEMAEIMYLGDDGQDLTYRKKAGDSDISGDYNVYNTEKEVTADGREAVLKGNGNKYNLAVWTYGRFSYSVYCKNGMTENEMLAVITEID